MSGWCRSDFPSTTQTETKSCPFLPLQASLFLCCGLRVCTKTWKNRYLIGFLSSTDRKVLNYLSAKFLFLPYNPHLSHNSTRQWFLRVFYLVQASSVCKTARFSDRIISLPEIKMTGIYVFFPHLKNKSLTTLPKYDSTFCSSSCWKPFFVGLIR